MAGENTDFWLALCTIGPVMFLALGALLVELDRERGPRWKRPMQKVQLAAMNVSFLGTLLATITAVLSFAWRSNLLPPKLLGVVTVVGVLAFWISLLAHLPGRKDVRKRHLTAAGCTTRTRSQSEPVLETSRAARTSVGNVVDAGSP